MQYILKFASDRNLMGRGYGYVYGYITRVSHKRLWVIEQVTAVS